MQSRAPSVRGFTLVETLVGVALFVVVGVSAYQAYTLVAQSVIDSRLQMIAASLANEQFEIIRNMPYADVGIVGGLPVGRVPHVQTLVRSGVTFTATTTIRNTDDPFDGTIGGTPNDLSPADYKLAEVEIGCPSCDREYFYTAQIGPRGLETTGNNGALFVRAFNASGAPIQGASVHVVRSATTTTTIDDETNNSGLLQIIDTPPGVQAYAITVSKGGYSTERTYPVGGSGNPNPAKPHATVATGQVTQVSFSIDELSTLQVASRRTTCKAVPDVDFLLQGSKLIGTTPDVLKYSASSTTDSTGNENLNGMEWDTYRFTLSEPGEVLAGLLPLSPFDLDPGVDQPLTAVLAPASARNLLVTVRDGASGAPISDATVQVSGGAYNQTLQTNRSSVLQSDWSGGSGQELWTVDNKYSSSNNVSTPSASLTLAQSAGLYFLNGDLTSSTFDIGSSGSFHTLFWNQGGTGTVKLQLASNNDNSTWNFVGPDGTASSYYTSSGDAIDASHQGHRYLRYKVYLSTNDAAVTPTAGEIGFWFTGACVPPGQVLFGGLSSGNYTVVTSKTGYQSASVSVSVGSDWQEQAVDLIP